ncbi:hypothetical protein D3C81_2334880 [compost metagenome]
MPVETALGHPQAARQRLDRDRADALLCDEVQGGLGPVFRAQAAVAAGTGLAGGSFRFIHALI